VRFKRIRLFDAPQEVVEKFVKENPMRGAIAWHARFKRGWLTVDMPTHRYISNRKDEWYVAEKPA